MYKILGDYSGRCGGCAYFAFVQGFSGRVGLSGGRCLSPKRKNYHDASAKACKLYVPYGSEEMSLKELSELSELSEKAKMEERDGGNH